MIYLNEEGRAVACGLCCANPRFRGFAWRQPAVANRTILTADKPVLRIKAKPVQRVDASIRKLMSDMVDTMHNADGAGLAAPQIGVSLRVIVLWHEDDQFKLVNPEIS